MSFSEAFRGSQKGETPGQAAETLGFPTGLGTAGAVQLRGSSHLGGPHRRDTCSAVGFQLQLHPMEVSYQVVGPSSGKMKRAHLTQSNQIYEFNKEQEHTAPAETLRRFDVA